MPDRCTVGAVAVLLVILFAGCSRHEPAAITVPADGRVLNLYSWAEYFPADVLHQFEAETGIKVNYAVFDSNDVAETTLSAGHSGFDLVTVNVAPHLGRQIPKGLWQPLDRTQLANFANADAKILALMERVDPGNRYAIPYMWGTIGLIYNAAKIRALLPAPPLDSLEMVLRPQFASILQRCGISVLDNWVDMVPLLSHYLGQPDLSAAPASIDAIATTFEQVRPYIRRTASTGYYDQIARGELCLAIGYSADAMVARRTAVQIGSGVRVSFSHPRETVPLYIDAFAIPADSRNAAAAHRFINFALRPEIAARLATATGFTIANPAAIALLDPSLRDNAIIYPSTAVRARLTLDRGYTMSETRVFSRAWLRMKTGQ